MEIAITTSSISRLAGGLFESVRYLALETLKANYNVKIYTLEDRYTEKDLKQWLPLIPKVHKRAYLNFFGYSQGFETSIYANRPTILHQHGIWMYPSIVSSKFAKQGGKTIISPRGMLDEWALQNSRWKKALALKLFERKNLQRAQCLHALSESEFESIRALGFRNPVCIIPNGVHLPVRTNLIPSWKNKVGCKKILLYLGRIHPKKGLKALLKAWARCPDEIKRSWTLVIAGWSQGGYEMELKKQAKDQMRNNEILFIGARYDKDKSMCYENADAFILPSLSEGLPMSVLEAWSFGVPVLMTSKCNLPVGFERLCAYEIGTGVDSLFVGLVEFFNLTEQEQAQYGQRGVKLVESLFSWPHLGDQMCTVYRWMLGEEEPPEYLIKN